MKLWRPEKDKRAPRKDGATIRYADFLGYWNSQDVEIAFDRMIEVEFSQNFPHYHEHMKEIYLVTGGMGVMLINEEKEIKIKNKELLMVEPGEVHRLFHVLFPNEYGPLEFFLVKAPSVKDDKIIVPATYERKRSYKDQSQLC